MITPLPLDIISFPNNEDRALGWDLIKKGKVAALLIAGGQGTRLGFSGPKGCYPITPVRKASLFQLFAEKTVAASSAALKDLPLIIMTSPLNDQETKDFFKSHENFGLKNSQLFFFTQPTLPFLTLDGKPFYEAPGKVAVGPDGNGSALATLAESGIAEQLEKQGVQYVLFTLVDNPLADPFDAALVGAHVKAAAEVTVKCIERSSTQEKVGLFVENNKTISVIEYSEFPKEEWEERNEDGSLKFNIANISLFCFSLSFIKKIAHVELPLHQAIKAAPYRDEAGTLITPKSPNAIKQERFIFDVLPYSDKTQIVLYQRDECFSPLKSHSGSGSAEEVQEALTRQDRKTLSALTGHPTPPSCLEIDPTFYYPSEELLQKWDGHDVGTASYVEAKR